MRKLSLKYWGLPVAIALGTAATPALADVFVKAEVWKDKDVTVTETININKHVDIYVHFDKVLDASAEALAIVNVSNVGNYVGSAGAVFDYGLDLNASISGSVLDNTGIVHFNQDVGNMVNQGNVLSLSSIGDGATAFTDSQAAVDQYNAGNTVIWEEYLEPDANNGFVPDKVASISGSINGNSGIVGVNQNAGNMNNQTNAVALSVGFGATLALSEALLGQENTGNFIHEVETVKVDTIEGSISGNSGIVSVNQSTGNLNNQGSVVAFSALTASANINVPNP